MPPSEDPARRAVVTGIGAVTPIGNDAATFWANLIEGVSGAGPITSFDPTGFDVRIAAEVKDFDPTDRDGPQDGPPDEPLHPLRDGRGDRGGRRTPGSTSRDWSLERRDRIAVVINTGGGGMEQVIDGTATLAPRARARSARSRSRPCRARWPPRSSP